MTYIVFDGYPMPPASYALFNNKFTGGRKRSREYNLYRSYVARWEFVNRQRVLRAAEAVKQWTLEPKALVRVHTYFAFQTSKLLTKKGTLKRLDASNRIKACHDTLAEVLGVDDLRFCAGEVDKVLATEDQVFIVLEPAKLRVLDNIRTKWILTK